MYFIQCHFFKLDPPRGRAKYGQIGCPWKDLAKCCLDALVLGQQDPPVKSYDQIQFLADFPIVITMQNLKKIMKPVLPKRTRMQSIEVETPPKKNQKPNGKEPFFWSTFLPT